MTSPLSVYHKHGCAVIAVNIAEGSKDTVAVENVIEVDTLTSTLWNSTVDFWQ